jgi:alkanesulfonate monooxygenase SsuD/methylene tetrahydromethanopterin reductase-like flavin-dependent oxidoreductase (luciferase family)
VQTRLPVLISVSLPRMLRLTTRHVDIWNARRTPDETAAGNEQLTALCREIGRYPATILCGISPSLNLLTSAEAFAAGVAVYQAAGFTDFQIPWPRCDDERTVLPALRTEAGR